MNSIVLNKFRRNNVIAAFGNPLLDISIVLSENTIIAKYDLSPDGQIEVDNVTFSDVLSSLKSEKYDLLYSPGGCAQNTMRIVQALMKHPSFCVFFGGIGEDDEGKILENELIACGVETRYAKHASYSTGKVVALINGENRSLVAHLGAAEHFSMKDFKSFENMRVLEEVYVVYTEGFFITHSFDVIQGISLMCQANGVSVVFNISGAYVAEKSPNELKATASIADIVIGNAKEFRSLACVLDLNVDSNNIEEVALKLHSSLWKDIPLPNYKLDQMKSFSKTIIITQGKDPVFCVHGDGSLIKFEVPDLDSKKVIDSTGAGDAFAAGFLVAFLKNKPVKDCLGYGCEIAQQVIQHRGVQLSNES